MSKYTDEELAEFLVSGDAQKHEDGQITWSVDNSLGKKPGTYLSRPPQAAPLYDSDTGADGARLRIEARRLALENGIAIGVSEALDDILGGKPLTTDEALTAIVARLAREGMDTERKDYVRIVALVLETLGLTQHKTKIDIDQRTQKIEVSASEVKILQQSPAIQRLVDESDGN